MIILLKKWYQTWHGRIQLSDRLMIDVVKRTYVAKEDEVEMCLHVYTCV